jgi:indolepyruvate ferredoxin oxidoreductase beta subunit
VQAGDDDVVRVWDHFKPGVPEMAGLLPRRFADALARWDRRRVARGREPFALPLKIGTHTLAGAFALRVLAGCRALRRRGSRWAAEQALIERWLAAIERGAREHPALGFEIAACGRLIKGYGATNERGKATLLHVIDELAAAAPSNPAAPAAEGRTTVADAHARATAIRAAREAALADASGASLDRTLAQHGAPPRPTVEQPVRFVRRRPGHVGKITSAPRAPSH